jgi:hypothetical protein
MSESEDDAAREIARGMREEMAAERARFMTMPGAEQMEVFREPDIFKYFGEYFYPGVETSYDPLAGLVGIAFRGQVAHEGFRQSRRRLSPHEPDPERQLGALLRARAP